MIGTKDFMHLVFSIKKTGQARYPQTPVPGKQIYNSLTGESEAELKKEDKANGENP